MAADGRQNTELEPRVDYVYISWRSIIVQVNTVFKNRWLIVWIQHRKFYAYVTAAHQD